MNISTYESQIKALEAGGGGGGGSSDGVFVITVDNQNMTPDKTFSEVKNAILNNTPIFIHIGGNAIPAVCMYVDDNTDILIDITMVTTTAQPTPVGNISSAAFTMSPDDNFYMAASHNYKFTITEA